MLTFSMSGGTLDRHEQARTRPGFAAACMQPKCNPQLVLVKGISIAVSGDGDGDAGAAGAGSWCRPLDSNVVSRITALDELVYLGEMDGGRGVHANVFALDVRHVDAAYAAQQRWVSSKSASMARLPRSAQAAIGLALSLCQWHGMSRYCARCGQATLATHDVGFSRRCTRCRAQYFPQLMPAVLVTVLDGAGCVLLSQRRASDPTLTILSGFVLHGESAEEAVRREVYEETGVRVRTLRYAGSQTWPYPNLLMLSYYAVADGPGTTPLTVQADELERVCWVEKAVVREALQAASAPAPATTTTTTAAAAAGGSTAPPSPTTATTAAVRVPPTWTAAHAMLRNWVDGHVDDHGGVASIAVHPDTNRRAISHL